MTLMKVEDVGKTFRDYRSEWHRIARWFGLPGRAAGERWVLKNISFDVSKGEAVGILGQNGAGKSTLLKVITGTLHASEGMVTVGGRVSAILELGMGFNPELSGRQNSIHSAGLMGFSAKDIAEKIDSIEEFAEIGSYFNEPLRTYSSGMQMRVAFAVATAWRPDILIVDEALSVGDAYFQHKCFNLIQEFQKLGTSLLIVSHDRGAIQTLCSRGILLENGRIIKDGNPEEVFDFYNAIIAEKEIKTIETSEMVDGRVQTSSGTGEVEITEIVLYDHEGAVSDHFDIGDLIELRIDIGVKIEIDNLTAGFVIKDRLGQPVFGTNTWHAGRVIDKPPAGSEYSISFKFPANIGVGSYSIAVALHADDSHVKGNYLWRDLAIIFNVINTTRPQFVGVSWLDPLVEVCVK